MKNTTRILTACTAGLALAATAIAPVSAQNKRQQDKNNTRNLGTGLGAAAAVEALRGKTTNAIILGAGAAYAGKKYEDARKAQSKENSRRYNYGAAPIEIMLNKEPMGFAGTPPLMMQDRVFVPIRGVLEEMGANIEWDSATQSVLANYEDRKVRLPINSYSATVNGRAIGLDAPARVVDGRTMVPLRFVAEAFGADVNWDAKDRAVYIDEQS